MGQDLAIHERALSTLTYGMYIATAHDGEKMNGQIVNVASQVTAEPMQMMICLNKQNLTHEYITASGKFGLTVLEQATPFPFIGTWGFKSGRTVNKFDGVAFRRSSNGVPLLLEHGLAVLECDVISRMDAGTHSVFLGKVVDGDVMNAGAALTYDYYRNVIKGKASKNAPTFRTQGG